jgi:hypothetical protein
VESFIGEDQLTTVTSHKHFLNVIKSRFYQEMLPNVDERTTDEK